MVKRNRRRPALKITGDGTGVVNHAGTRLLADLADAGRADRCVVGGDGTDEAASSWSRSW